jgi:hypothetical protein
MQSMFGGRVAAVILVGLLGLVGDGMRVQKDLLAQRDCHG